MSIDLGLLILRVAVGLILAAHGAQKVFGWFGGPGMQGLTGWMGSLGLKPAWFWALLGAFGEFGGGLLLALGLLSPLGPLALLGAMAMAIGLAHWSKGFWAQNSGYEYPLILLVVSFVFGLLGPGVYSLDALFGIVLPIAPLFWFGLIGVVVVVAFGLIQSKQQAASQQATA